MTEDEMAGQGHQSYQHEFDTTPGSSGRQEGLACSGLWGHEESDMTERLNNEHEFCFIPLIVVMCCQVASFN